MGDDRITRMEHEAIVNKLRAELDLWRAKNTTRAEQIKVERDLAELREAARNLDASLRAAESRSYYEGHGISTVPQTEWSDVARKRAVLAALLPAEPPKEASDGK